MKAARNPDLLSEWTSQHLAEGLQRLIGQLENDPSLLEPNQLRQRLEALDRLDTHFSYSSQGVPDAQAVEPALYRRARAICDKLAAANRALCETIRGEIRSGARPDALLRWVHPSLEIEHASGPANDLGYDYLDELISGVLPFEEPDAGHIARDSEKVFYQPTPARHIFSLIELTALSATDVLVELGSGLGHVPILISICTGARSVGIELEATYVECARRCARKLNLNRVTFLQQDARAADLSIGTVFYLYTPFKGSILRAELERLNREAATHRIRICSYGPCTAVVAEEPWLEAITTTDANRIALFCSREGERRNSSGPSGA